MRKVKRFFKPPFALALFNGLLDVMGDMRGGTGNLTAAIEKRRYRHSKIPHLLSNETNVPHS